MHARAGFRVATPAKAAHVGRKPPGGSPAPKAEGLPEPRRAAPVIATAGAAAASAARLRTSAANPRLNHSGLIAATCRGFR